MKVEQRYTHTSRSFVKWLGNLSVTITYEYPSPQLQKFDLDNKALSRQLEQLHGNVSILGHAPHGPPPFVVNFDEE